MTKTAQQPPKLVTMNGNALLNTEFAPLRFTAEKILPHGLFILAGSPKIGKSWLALDLCRAVATGEKLWEFAATQGDVLYLALEDRYRRIQDRLFKIGGENADMSRFHTAIASAGLSDGLPAQIHEFVAAHPQTNLIIIDTLEHIRNTGDGERSLYACDYRDMNALREITDQHDLTLLLIHHTRKQGDADPLNTISGSTGLTGATDGLLVLQKARRIGPDARLTIANRDTEGFCFNLRFNDDNCRWEFIGHHTDEVDVEDEMAAMLDSFLPEQWTGTATDLLAEFKKVDSSFDVSPAMLAKWLKGAQGLLQVEYNIAVEFERERSCRRIILRRIGDELGACDGVTDVFATLCRHAVSNAL